ncbi:FAS1 domain-containing protein [Meredithblackwellia eburnea MCA 4105]
MKLRSLSWLGLALSSATISNCSPEQRPFEPPSTAPSPPTASSISLVDILAASPNHTLLLKAFQRARLIPTLNRLNGSTLFAPSDDAIKQESAREKQASAQHSISLRDAVWTYAIGDPESTQEGDAAAPPAHDNLQLALRDTLLYHVLNYTYFPPPSPPPNSSAEVPPSSQFRHFATTTPSLEETLYFPSLNAFNKSFPIPPSLPGSPPDNPDPDNPTGVEGLLKGEGQKVRLVQRGKKELWIGVDSKGEGGIKVVDSSLQFATNGALVVVDGVLSKPEDISKQIRTDARLSVLASLLPPALLDYISTAPHLTVFAPTNDAWKSLSDLEMRYLRSGFAETDMTEIFGDGATQVGKGKGKVGYMKRLVGENGTSESDVQTLFGSPLHISTGPNGVNVNGTAIETTDILAKNGVIHLVPNLLLPSGSLSLTAEKYLIALNATKFVSLLRSVNLSSLVQIPSGEPSVFLNKDQVDPPKSYTILALTDNVIESSMLRPSAYLNQLKPESDFGSPELVKGLPAPGSKELKDILQYHIVAGKWVPANLEDGMLLGTELRGDNLKGARQKVQVSVHVAESSGRGGWDMSSGKGGKNGPRPPGVVGFGGTSVIADPVTVGDSIIYLISSVLDPPTSLVTTAVSDLRLSTFVASIYAASLDKVLGKTAAISYLIPHNNAFTSLGLVMSYLLLPTSRAELRSVIQYHAIDELAYIEDFPSGGSLRYPTLGGAEIYVERSGYNSSLFVHGPTIAGQPANGETRDAKVVEGDILISTGVIHVIDQVELPPDLSIDHTKLLAGAKATTMVDLIQAANMSWLLDGKTPPSKFLEDDAEEGNEDDEEVPDSTKGKQKKGKKPKRRAGDYTRAYTILCPTDRAFSRVNLTYYFSNKPALVELVKLHVIPTSAFAPLTGDGRPLALTDEVTYPTLLDKSEGGGSQYGSLAFRRWGEDEWVVGIKSARGTNGQSDSAKVIAYGRATPVLVGGDDGGSAKLAASGGLFVVDSVLLPYQPGWFRRFGWIIVVVVLGLAVTACIGLLSWKLWTGKKVLYERLEGEED